MTTEKPKTRSRWVLAFQLLLVMGFLALVWFIFAQTVLNPPKAAGVPDKLAGLELDSQVEGPEALARINQLHGTDIRLVKAYIAEYSHGNQRVTAWVAAADSPQGAAELIRRMAQGIERGGSAFSNLQRLTIGDQEVFEVEGPGGKSFFYHAKEPADRVVWLTIAAPNAMPLLGQAVKTF